MLYESLNTKVKTLPDDVIIYPAHGPGSACGKNIGKETWSTIGEQKKLNYALQQMSKETFIEKVTFGLAPPPPYFFKDAQINKDGYEEVEKVIHRNLRSLSVEELKKSVAAGALVLDTRIPDVFEKGFIPGSLNIGLNGQFAVWVGTVLDIDRPLVLVSEKGKEEETVLRLARVGYEKVLGVLGGGFDSWKNAGEKTDTVQSVSADAFATQLKAGGKNVLDVRREGEYNNSHVEGSQHCALDYLLSNLDKVDKNKSYYIHCAAGYRSMIASSILKMNGIHNIVNVYGGFNKIRESDAPIVSEAIA